jgi:hypothetical protein
MPIFRILAAFILIAGTWWSMADVARSSGFIQSHIAGTLVAAWVSPPPADGLNLIEDGDAPRQRYLRSCVYGSHRCR